MTFRYSSRIRALERSSSSQRVTTSSRSLRSGLLRVVKKRFLASCWVIVLPPRAKRPFLPSTSTDFSIASQSIALVAEELLVLGGEDGLIR